ncbi:hypothetical protein Tco_0754986 [Tanacetum coccineum]
MAGSDNESDDASVHSEATIAQQQQNSQPQIITIVLNNNAKFPYLKKDEYEVWAMKMEYWITNNDMNIWKRESKARTTLLQSIPDDHVADFHYMDDARDIWNAVMLGLVEYAMQKILSQLNQLKAKPEDEDINLKFLRALLLPWSKEEAASIFFIMDTLKIIIDGKDDHRLLRDSQSLVPIKGIIHGEIDIPFQTSANGKAWRLMIPKLKDPYHLLENLSTPEDHLITSNPGTAQGGFHNDTNCKGALISTRGVEDTSHTCKAEPLIGSLITIPAKRLPPCAQIKKLRDLVEGINWWLREHSRHSGLMDSVDFCCLEEGSSNSGPVLFKVLRKA